MIIYIVFVCACQPGERSAGVAFWLGRKPPKTHQREFPLESPGFICFFRFGPKTALGLVGRIGWLGTSLDDFYSAVSFHSLHQGLKSGRSGLARPLSAGVRHR